jgi:hypothetical protein
VRVLVVARALSIVSVLLPIVALAQADDKITPAEAKQAVRLAHRFAEDLVRYKDFGPLIPKYFISGFEGKLPDVAVPILTDAISRTPHVQSRLRRFYVAQNNFILLTYLYRFANPDTESDSFPKDVERVIDSDPALWKKLTEDKNFDRMSPKENNRVFDRGVRLLERVNMQLRKHVMKLTVDSPSIKPLLKPQSLNGYSTFDAWVYTCDKRCYLDLPFPKGTRLIIVEMPFLQQMVLVSHRRELRVVASYLSVD